MRSDQDFLCCPNQLQSCGILLIRKQQLDIPLSIPHCHHQGEELPRALNVTTLAGQLDNLGPRCDHHLLQANNLCVHARTHARAQCLFLFLGLHQHLRARIVTAGVSISQA